MKKFESVEDILDFAINEEIEAAEFYRGMVEKVDEKWMKAVFEDFAKEEEGHRKKLEAIKSGKSFPEVKGNTTDLKIGDYLVDVDTEKDDLGYQEALIIAMKKEKSAFKLYSDLARETDNEDIRNIFLALAQEEAKHKLRFEVEYDDVVLAEN
jgi:rubrerythrin